MKKVQTLFALMLAAATFCAPAIASAAPQDDPEPAEVDYSPTSSPAPRSKIVLPPRPEPPASTNSGRPAPPSPAVPPNASPAPEPEATRDESRRLDESRPGLGAVGAGVGLTFGLAAGALGVAIDVIDPRLDVAVPMGVTSLVLHGAAVPIAFRGSKASRRDPNIAGNRGLRTASWIGYGTTFGLAAVALTTNADGTGVAYGLSAAVSAIGMSAEALIARKQALRAKQARIRPAQSLSLAPYGSRRELGVSLAGRF